MKNRLLKLIWLSLILAFTLMLFSPFSGVVMASNTTQTTYRAVIRVTNSGATAAYNVSVPVTINTSSMISNLYFAANLSNTAMQDNYGVDAAYNPAVVTNTTWMFFVPVIPANSSVDYSLFVGGNLDAEGKLAYFPGTAGMTTADNSTLELGEYPFECTFRGFVDTTSVGNYCIQKSTALSIYNGSTGNLTACFNTANITASVATGYHELKLSTSYAINGSGFGNNRISIPNDSSLNPNSSNFTRSFWVSFNDFPPLNYIFYAPLSSGNSEAVYYNATAGNLSWDLSGIASVTDSWAPALNTWYNIICERISDDFNIYVDGSLVATDSAPGALVNIVVAPMSLAGVTGGVFNGRMQDYRYLDRAISAGERTEYGSGVYSNNSSLKLYLRLDEGSGTDIGDSSSSNITCVSINRDWGKGLYDYFYIDNTLGAYDVKAPAITNNINSWVTGAGGVVRYLESQTITINGTLKQSIGWQNAAIFVDQSGNGQNATPTFRTTSSNANVSASLVDFQANHQAQLESWDLYAYTNPIGDIPSMPGGMYEGVNPVFPGHSIPDEISTAGGIPTGLFWFLIPCLLVCLVGIIIHDKTKSLFAQTAIVLLCVLFISLIHIWSFWVIIPIAIMSIAACLAGKVYGY